MNAGALPAQQRAAPPPGPGELAPRPRSVEETGLSVTFLGDLVCKLLRVAGTLELDSLSRRLALSGALTETILHTLRGEGKVEVHGAAATGGGLRYALTDKGRATALDAHQRSGYVGPAPVPLALYEQVAKAQSVHASVITRADIRDVFSGVVVRDAVLDRLGPALHSGRALFVYGHPGTGKTFICRRLCQLLQGAVLVPHAIAVSETVVQVLDPAVHKPVGRPASKNALLLDQGHDERFVLCERPVVTVGGELTMELLDVQYDAAARLYNAPVQLRANNGMLLLDDLGRQRASPAEVLNRWIVPLEEHRDFLNIEGRHHFSVPFDLVLVFSTNLNPLELADEAFLRRIGYKVRFEPLRNDEYKTLWNQVCAEHEIECPADSLDYLIDGLHRAAGTPLLPCHPRDLAGLTMDHFRYEQRPRVLDRRAIDWAWNNYFVNLD